METLRKIGSFFSLKKSSAKDNDEPNTQDVVDLMQQQQEQQDNEEQADNTLRDIPRPPASRFPFGTTEPPVESGSMLAMPLNVPGVPYFDREPGIEYSLEFVKFMDHNAPVGFAQKLHKMLPYLGLSLFSWPSYWLWRGYHWQTRRRTERIGMYIQRTFQHAKLMQVVILGVGLIVASSAHSSASGPLEVHEVSYSFRQPPNLADD